MNSRNFFHCFVDNFVILKNRARIFTYCRKFFSPTSKLFIKRFTGFFTIRRVISLIRQNFRFTLSLLEPMVRHLHNIRVFRNLAVNCNRS